MLYIIAAGIIVFLLLAYIYFGKSRKTHILITGICNSGKTSFFTTLVHKRHPLTFTSLSPNNAVYELKTHVSRRLQVVDVPGLEKLRFECINKYKDNAAGIIYVIDSTSINKLVKDVAEYLYNLMTDPVVARNRSPFLILCNKQDLPNAKTAVAIERMLEIELTTLCRTKADGLAGLDGHPTGRPVRLIKADEKFSFGECGFHRITFGECNATSTDISDARSWLERL